MLTQSRKELKRVKVHSHGGQWKLMGRGGRMRACNAYNVGTHCPEWTNYEDGEFWDLDTWSCHRVKITHRFWDFCFIYLPINYVFYHLHVFSDWFSNIFTPKFLHFLLPIKSKAIKTKCPARTKLLYGLTHVV